MSQQVETGPSRSRNSRSRGSLLSLFIELISFQTARGRLSFFGLATVGIFLAPYSWLAHLSLWQYLGIHSPSIGLTRAYWRLLHGDVAGAYDRNPLIFVVLAIGIPLLIFDIVHLWRHKKKV